MRFIIAVAIKFKYTLEALRKLTSSADVVFNLFPTAIVYTLLTSGKHLKLYRVNVGVFEIFPGESVARTNKKHWSVNRAP